MKFRKPKEYQIISLFIVLGALTLATALLFEVVLFAPQAVDVRRAPAQKSELNLNELDLKTERDLEPAP